MKEESPDLQSETILFGEAWRMLKEGDIFHFIPDGKWDVVKIDGKLYWKTPLKSLKQEVTVNDIITYEKYEGYIIKFRK